MALHWNRRNAITLFETYHAYPVLWDRNHPDYNEKSKRKEADLAIFTRMQEKMPKITLKDLKKKFNAARTQFREFLIGMKLRKVKKRLWCYDHLEFLLPFVNVPQKVQQAAKRNFTRTEVRWNQENTEELIGAYAEENFMWDETHPDFYNKEKRKKSLGYITEQLRAHLPNVTGADIKLKIKELQNDYFAASEELLRGVEPSLWCFHLLKFLQAPSLEIDDNTAKDNENLQYIYETQSDSMEYEYLEEFSGELKALNDKINYKTSRENSDEKINNNIKEEIIPKCLELENNNGEFEKTGFHWVGEQIVSTLNDIKDENIFDEAITKIQQVLQAAITRDKKIRRAK